MTNVACRWPGGMTLAVPRVGADPMTVFVAGPPGQPSVTDPADDNKPPSRMVATAIQKAVADTMDRLRKSCAADSSTYDPNTYGVTVVPNDFWAAWYQQNQTFDVVTCGVVFALN